MNATQESPTTTTTPTRTTTPTADVVVVGAGPAGLSAAIALRKRGVANVVVLERESQAGGVPRHTNHLGYGLRDLHRMMSGPRYAAELRRRAEAAGVDIRTATTALDWLATTTLQIVDSHGVAVLSANAVLLSTGVRERPRAARLVPGERGAGVFTTGSLQQLTAQRHQRPGHRAVIVGAEHVSFSAVLTLRHAGCEVVAMVTPLAHHQSYTALRVATASRHRVPIITNCEIAEICGRTRVEAVVLTNGQRLACDTVVFTGDWIPDHELARRGGINIDDSHRGPIVDGALRTNRRGVFAAGNLVHPAETADICALDGRHVATSIVDWLTIGEWPTDGTRIRVRDPIAWISPSLVHPSDGAPLDRLTLRVSQPIRASHISAMQGGSVLWRGRPRGQLIPHRSISIPAEWLSRIDVGVDADDVVMSVDELPQR